MWINVSTSTHEVLGGGGGGTAGRTLPTTEKRRDVVDDAVDDDPAGVCFARAGIGKRDEEKKRKKWYSGGLRFKRAFKGF